MATMQDLKEILEDQGRNWQAFKQDYDLFKSQVDNDLKRMNRPNFGGGGSNSGGGWTGDRKEIELGVRALFRGDQSAAMRHFSESKAMQAGSSIDGGYLVLGNPSPEMTRVALDISPISGLAREVNLSQGDSFQEVIDKNVAEANWVGETTPSPRDDTDTPDIGLFNVELRELCAYPKLTQKLIDTSSIDPVVWLQGKLTEAFAAKESTAFHSGEGVADPRGFLTYPVATTGDATRTWGTIQYIPTTASGAFATASTSVNSADVLIDVVGALKAQYRSNASWLMSRSTAGTVRKIKDADGRHVWVDSLVLGAPSTLLGYPVYLSEDMPTVAADSFSIAFGNWQKAYTIIRRMGVRFLVDPYSAPPFVKLHAYQRVGGGVNNFEAIKLLKFGST